MRYILLFSGVTAWLFGVTMTRLEAKEHRATNLGNPETRFANPLYTSEDLRDRFADAKLRPDIASILRQWGWKGNLDDLFGAAATNEIADIQLPTGTRMPFMSSRRKGKPITLKDVVWAGKEPAPAYAFEFSSNGRRYRCVTPKACSNFYVVDMGTPSLALKCEAPAESLVGQPVKVCLTVRNDGDLIEPRTIITLPVPAGAEYVSPTRGKLSSADQLKWEIADLPVGDTREFCVIFSQREPGSMAFVPVARSEYAQVARSECSTRIAGITAVLIEVVDLKDPVEVGTEVNYVIKVVNQGSAAGTNMRVVCKLLESQEFVSGTGITPVQASERIITMEPLPSLAPKAEAVWNVLVKAKEAGDIRFTMELTSDQYPQAIPEEESTRQY